jgi:signal transduction histidine kinase
MSTTAAGPVTFDVDAATRSLTTFVRWDQAACGAGVVALVATYATLERDPVLLVEAALVALAGAALGQALRPLRRGDCEAAVTRFAVVTWCALLAPSVITPFVEPLMLLAALLPVVLAVPYVSPTRLLVFVAAAAGTSVIVLGLARGPLDLAVTDQVPRWLPHTVAFAFVPVLSALLGIVVLHHHATMRASLDQVRATNERLVAVQRDLVAQAQELRLSRARVVTATDEERRRIERDLHDGAQQRLLALTIDLTVARASLPDDATGARELVLRATESAATAMREIRDLARGVYPATLTDHGLVDALAAVLAQWPGRGQLVAAPIGRYPREIEAAVYFSCSEAVHNAIRHAGPGATVTVRLRGGPDLAFEVADDGVGFDASRGSAGRGLTNIADRMAAVGGDLTVDTRLGAGTTVRAVVPHRAVARAGGPTADLRSVGRAPSPRP